MRAIGYVRVSTDGQAESGLSLTAQREKVAAMATLKDLELVDIIEDAASACSLDRDGLGGLLDRVNRGEVDVVVVAKLDRLTRSVRDLGHLLDTLAKAKRADGERGVGLQSVAESLDTETAAGRLVLNVMGAVSQWEREAIGERTREALSALKAQGKRTGKVRYGFDALEDGKLVENADEQAVLETVRTMRAEGATHQKIRDTLEADGVLNRNGKPFSRVSITTMLQRYGGKAS